MRRTLALLIALAFGVVTHLGAEPSIGQSGLSKEQILSKIKPISSSDGRHVNVVLMLADDLGYADTGIYGSQTIPTPHIDSLARDGVRFSSAYVTAGTCSPSRAGLVTGRYQQRFGFEFNTAGAAVTHRMGRGLDTDAVTIADIFQRAGYATGMFGKWHLGTREKFHPMERGFDEFFGFLAGAHSFFPAQRPQQVFSTIMRNREPLIEPEYLTDAFARETVRFIRENKERPFFAYVPFNAVHTPLEASQKYLDRFPEVTQSQQQAYNAMTSALDDAVGTIVEALNQAGQEDNTLVILLNDNGGPIYTGVQSNGPLKLGKLFLFEGGVRVPMTLKLPGAIQQNSVFDQPTSSLDVLPTACRLAGIELPDELELDGVDLLPFLSGESNDAPHDSLFWSNGPNIAARVGDWKMVQAGDHAWLFDLEDDLGETTNLASERPEVLEKLQDAYRQWRKDMKTPAWPSKPNRRVIDVDGFPYELNI